MSIEKKYCEKRTFPSVQTKTVLFGYLEMMNKI